MNAPVKSFQHGTRSVSAPQNTMEKPRVSSQDLMQGQTRVIIEHEGTEYTLHLTRQNKLLLTK